jgi:hypothetical protein
MDSTMILGEIGNAMILLVFGNCGIAASRFKRNQLPILQMFQRTAHLI